MIFKKIQIQVNVLIENEQVLENHFNFLISSGLKKSNATELIVSVWKFTVCEKTLGYFKENWLQSSC